MRRIYAASVLLALTPAATLAEEKSRELGAHEHGVGQLNMAFEGGQVALELEAPGADIVGFEYEATSDADRALIDAAIADLARPLEWFVLPASAGCTVVEARVALLGDDDHDHHDHGDEHAEDDHDHDDHGDDDHAEDEHAHDDHGDEDHAEDEHAHDDHDHDEHAEGESEHTEFHAEYMLNCASPDVVDSIEFAYFDRFPNALELEVQIVTDSGANSFEVERDEPVLDLRGMF